jgi:hypothetical protein
MHNLLNGFVSASYVIKNFNDSERRQRYSKNGNIKEITNYFEIKIGEERSFL